MNEEAAYQAYHTASFAVPHDALAARVAFEVWRNIWVEHDKKERAYLLMKRMAKEWPLDRWFVDIGMGNCECFFCGGAYYEGNPHSVNCFAVLLQEFGE